VLASLLLALITGPVLAANVTLLNDGFEGTFLGSWDAGSLTQQNYPHSGAYSARGSSSSVSNLTSTSLSTSNAVSITVDF